MTTTQTTTTTAKTPKTPTHPMLAVVRQMVEAAGKTTEFETAEEFHLSVTNEPYMRLVIEAHPSPLARTFGATRVISVTHYTTPSDPWEDTLTDTDVEFTETGRILSLTVGYGRFFTRCYSVEDDGTLLIYPKATRSASSFARMWARNLRAQGFVKAAKNLRTK